MRRWVAILLLCLASFYVGATRLDQCTHGPGDDPAPICHLSCMDGCATAPVPEPPVPPAPEPLPRPRYAAEGAQAPASLPMEPPRTPPRS